MPSTVRKIFLGLLLVPALVASAAEKGGTRISSEKPVLNFRLPTFTPEGFRKAFARGSEARLISDNEINIKELSLSLFSGDQTDRVETLILSPSATIFRQEEVVTGQESIRVVNDEFEASGIDWRYSDQAKKITINQRVRVKFRAEITNLLQ